MAKNRFGSVRMRSSGRFQARYTGPDGMRYTAPTTFLTKGDANAWLAVKHSEIVRDVWNPPTGQGDAFTLGEFWSEWIETRVLRPRTDAHYRDIYAKEIEPIFGHVALKDITPVSVRAWHRTLAPNRPTWRAHAYGLLRTLLNSAVYDGILSANPCHVRGAGTVKRVHKVKEASLDELATIVEEMPDRLKAMTLLAAWCALRFGELAELRRKDIDLTNGVVHVRRGVVRGGGGNYVVGKPKTDAGIRDVNVPPHLMPVIRDHLKNYTKPDRDALLFPSADGKKHLAPSALYAHYYPAREAAGRKDLRFHDLRHTGAVNAATMGATLADLMSRLGHSSAGAALRYQHAAEGRDALIAKALSRLATGEDQETAAKALIPLATGEDEDTAD